MAHLIPAKWIQVETRCLPGKTTGLFSVAEMAPGPSFGSGPKARQWACALRCQSSSGFGMEFPL